MFDFRILGIFLSVECTRNNRHNSFQILSIIHSAGRCYERKKQVWIIIVVVALLLVAVASQGYNIYMGTFTFGRTTVETTAPGEYTNEGTTFVLYGKLNSHTGRKGTIEHVDYTTDVYEDGVTYSKYCNVYLPYGYDANDIETKYNVLYYY